MPVRGFATSRLGTAFHDLLIKISSDVIAAHGARLE